MLLSLRETLGVGEQLKEVILFIAKLPHGTYCSSRPHTWVTPETILPVLCLSPVVSSRQCFLVSCDKLKSCTYFHLCKDAHWAWLMTVIMSHDSTTRTTHPHLKQSLTNVTLITTKLMYLYLMYLSIYPSDGWHMQKCLWKRKKVKCNISKLLR